MADGLGRVPVEAEMAAGDGEVGGDGQFFTAPWTEKGAVIADAEPKRCAGRLAGSGADVADQVQFAGIGGAAC
jgi:hypothetical protein